MKYLLITASEEPNIGVLRWHEEGGFDMMALIQALQEHFDCDINILSHNHINTYPLYYTVKAERIQDDEPYEFTVSLSETWLY